MSTDWSGSVRAAGPVLLIALAIQALLGWVGARAYLTDHNTLLANGRWSSTKVELEKGLNGSYSFIHELQSLAGGRLNVAAWHGFQEVLWKEEVEDLRSLEFDFELLEKGAFAAILDRAAAGGPYTAVRFSGAGNSALFRVSEQGEFLSRRSVSRKPLPSNRVHRARIEIGDGQVAVFVDGEELANHKHRAPRERQRFGFRGSFKPALIDNVVARLGDGTTIRESFDSPPGAGRLTVALITALAVLNLALFLLLAALLDVPGRELGFYFLMINLTLLVIGTLAYFFVAERSSWYPGLNRSLAEREVYFRKGEAAKVKAEVAERLAELDELEREEELYRILFIGSSQTWGAGAAREEETFVAQLEGLLNAGRTTSPRVACINGGISSTRAPDLLPLVEQWLEEAEPDMLVVNLSSNDMATKARDFEAAIRTMVEGALARGGQPVLIQEPRIFREGRLGLNHRWLELIGDDYGVPVIEMLRYLQGARREGFPWWDKVHLTSFGQYKMAQRLHDELLPLIQAEAAAAASAAP